MEVVTSALNLHDALLTVGKATAGTIEATLAEADLPPDMVEQARQMVSGILDGPGLA